MDIKVEADENLGRVLAVLARAESGTQEAMREEAANEVDQTWDTALLAAASTDAERRILASGADAEIGPASINLFAAFGPASLSGGATEEHWAAFEFGMTPEQRITKRRKKLRVLGSGREINSTPLIWVGRNLRPRNPQGYVIFPVIRQHGPEFVAAWIRGLINVFRGAPVDIEKD